MEAIQSAEPSNVMPLIVISKPIVKITITISGRCSTGRMSTRSTVTPPPKAINSVSANAGQFATVTKHMLELNWAPLVGGAIVRKRTWERIPEDLRAELLHAASEVGREIRAAGRKESDDAVEAMKTKQGLTVHQLAPDALEEWRKATLAVYPKIRGKLVPAEMFDKVEQLLNEYRAGKGRN